MYLLIYPKRAAESVQPDYNASETWVDMDMGQVIEFVNERNYRTKSPKKWATIPSSMSWCCTSTGKANGRSIGRLPPPRTIVDSYGFRLILAWYLRADLVFFEGTVGDWAGSLTNDWVLIIALGEQFLCKLTAEILKNTRVRFVWRVFRHTCTAHIDVCASICLIWKDHVERVYALQQFFIFAG